jgi:hypothetical protein
MDDSAARVDADPDELAREALDTLPSNVAVLDAEGRILFTNRSWQDFAVESGADPESLDPNYLAVSEGADEADADVATQGIRAVLDGETDVFTHEYPCHSPEEKRWFLMRATRFGHAGETFVVVAHVDITDRKLAELTAADRAAEVREERQVLEHLLDRINGLIADVTQAVVSAGSRSDVEAAACETLAEAEPYTLAWIGAPDIPGQRLVTHASAGGTSDLADLELSLDGDSPVAQAARDGELRVADGDAGWPLDEAACEAVMAVPVTYRDTGYGVLAVCARDADAFDERERVVLAALGRLLGTAMNAHESKELLSASRVVQAEYAISDPSFLLNDVSRRSGTRLDFEGSVYREDDALLLFFTGEGDPGPTVEAARDHDGMVSANCVAEYGDEYLLELVVADPLVSELAEYGARVTELTVADGTTRLTVSHPHETNARSVFDVLSERFDGVELRSYRKRDPPGGTRAQFAAKLESRLTERQLTALRKAYHAGYFDRPRPVSGDDLAASMGISRSTFHQHLQVAQRKLLAQVFDAE